MRILPVIDLMGGQVVRGVAGRRAEYRPLVSRLTASTAPRDVARAFLEHFGLHELYVADLDAIAGQPPAIDAITELLEDGFRLSVDAGIASLDVLFSAGVHNLVLGLESLAGPHELRDLVRRFTPVPLIFSLDLKAGEPLGNRAAWGQASPEEIARTAVACGMQQLLVLDLAQVGMRQGTGTEDLCQRLRQAYPRLRLLSGGGVQGPDDLRRLGQLGIDAALAASALHDGRLTRADLT